jgi:hypothetical protein
MSDDDIKPNLGRVVMYQRDISGGVRLLWQTFSKPVEMVNVLAARQIQEFISVLKLFTDCHERSDEGDRAMALGLELAELVPRCLLLFGCRFIFGLWIILVGGGYSISRSCTLDAGFWCTPFLCPGFLRLHLFCPGEEAGVERILGKEYQLVLRCGYSRRLLTLPADMRYV